MKTSFKQLGDVEIQVDVEIPAADVDKEYHRQLTAIRRQARVKGFRPGKAPKAIIKRMYGMQISSDATRALISQTLNEALRASDRVPVGEPAIEPSLAQEGESLKYTLRIQVKPVIDVSDWEGLEVEAPSADVASASIDEQLEKRQKDSAERVPVEGRGAATDDIVMMDIVGRIDGETDERLTTPGLEVTLGSETLISGFEEQLEGVKPDEFRTVSVTFPEEYHAPDLAGKAAEFDCTVNGVFAEELPELDDDFAKDIGFDDLAALRADIEGKLKEDLETTRRQVIEDKLVSVLLDRHAFKAPSSMVKMQTDSQVRRMMSFFRAQGMGAQEAMKMVEENSHDISQGADASVRRYLLLDAFAEQQSIEIDDETLNTGIIERVTKAGSYGARLFESDEQKESLRLELRDEAALALLLEHATVTDAPIVDEGEPSSTEEATGKREDDQADSEKE